MDRQGDRRRHEDAWWRELYEDDGDAAARDTGPADAARDSLDDRVDSAFRTVGQAPDAVPPAGADAGTGRGTGAPAGPAFEPEPMALPAADPAALDDLLPDTELDGAGYGTLTLRAASLRGEAARHRGEPRGDALLTARFGAGQHALILVAVATAAPGEGSYAYGGAHRAARDACRWIGGAVGRSYTRLAEDVRTGNRDALKAGLHRLTDRSYGKLRAYAGEHGMEPGQYTAALRCLLLPADPACRTRVFFGVGAGGFFRLSNGGWQDLEPPPPEDMPGGPAAGASGRETLVDTPRWPVPGAPGPDTLVPDAPGPSTSGADTVSPDTAAPNTLAPNALPPDLGGTLPGLPRAPSGQPWQRPYEPAPRTSPEPFRFRTVAARPGDLLLLCSAGFAGPLTEAAGFGSRLAARWTVAEPPGLAAFLADVRLHAEGYGQDRTAVAVWERPEAADAVRPG
ncbi:protein phosphatase 2C domain-containing protein [Streptomyces rimosus]|uniref:protein phosphatase 2C domain-containing protein n=1 Tax=Streptomyces rimosus TaxID=1927 RepID=UPI0004C615AC|nr:protein phosphatase 2C domain-containing protein [Streptomyces rimosus]